MFKSTNKYVQTFCTKRIQSKNKYIRTFCTKNNFKPIGEMIRDWEKRHGLNELDVDEKINKLVDIFADKGLKVEYNLKKNMTLNELIEWFSPTKISDDNNMIKQEQEQKNVFLADKNEVFFDSDWPETQRSEFLDLWHMQSRIPELQQHHPLEYCGIIVGYPPKMLFKRLPKLTADSTLESCFIINFNSLQLIDDIDTELFPIANELLMITYVCSEMVSGHKFQSYISPDVLEKSEYALTHKLIELLNKNIIDKTLCLDSQFKECFNEIEFNNMNTALQNLIQSIKKCKLIMFNINYV